MKENLSMLNMNDEKQNKLTKMFASLAVLILLVSLFFWWQKVYISETNVFYGAIENNLRASSITKVIANENNKLIAASELTPDFRTRVINIQKIDNQDSKTHIQTEAIYTQKSNYERYNIIDTNVKNPDGKSPDFSKLINQWGESPADQMGQMNQQYILLLSGAVPIGDFNSSERKELMEVVKKDKVYTFDATKVKKYRKDNRLLYEYAINFNQKSFFKLLKKYGELRDISQLRDLPENDMQEGGDMQINITIDARSHKIISVIDPSGGDERFGSYGLQESIKLPTKTMPITELESKLKSVQE